MSVMRLRLILLLIVSLCSVASFALETESGPYKVSVVTDPAVPVVGKATLKISVRANGKPVSGLRVHALAQMPGMPMGEKDMDASPVAGQPGLYTAPAVLAMEGGYDVRVSIDGSAGHSIAVVPIKTGESTAGSNINYTLVVAVLVAAAFVVLVVSRMRRTGQKISLRPLLSATVIWSLIFLAAALGVTLYAINHYRRPGAMTPLEAQGMQMETPAPLGVTPVVLATVRSQPFGASVRYTGQAVGNVQQDVMSRVTGTLIWMPFYTGDAVKKGEVIARLDTSQLDPQLAQSAAGVDTASRAVGVAQSDYQQAQAGVSEAEAELSQYQGAVEEAKANLDAVKQDRLAANSQLASAKADLSTAQAGVSSAEADQSYFAKQAARSDALLAAGAISQEQAQRAHADAAKADSAALQAHQAVIAAQASIDAANANIKKADAQIVMAQKKVQEAQSELMTHHAHVRTARAAVASSSQKISQAQAETRQAQAALAGAAAAKDYATIRAETDGVITDRLISPGTLVNPGQPIVRIAQVSPIRLQANVAESDLASIHVGDKVLVRHRDSSETELLARVTSVSPSLDPSARTGIVEAVVSNADRRFLPGQFLTMDISTGHSSESLTVPASAVQSTLGDSPQHFVWVAVRSSSGVTVTRREVEIGATSGDSIAILKGLRSGDQVVVQGAAELTEGQAISPQSSDQLMSNEGVTG